MVAFTLLCLEVLSSSVRKTDGRWICFRRVERIFVDSFSKNSQMSIPLYIKMTHLLSTSASQSKISSLLPSMEQRRYDSMDHASNGVLAVRHPTQVYIQITHLPIEMILIGL